MAATHDPTIQITILLDPPPATASGFLPALAGDIPVGHTITSKVLRFATPDDVRSAESGGTITTAVKDALIRGLAQNPAPGEVAHVQVDVTGAEAYEDAIATALDEDEDLYGFAIDTRTAADQLAVSLDIEARDRLFVFQSDDSDIITSGFPSTYTTIEDSENTVGLYHDDGDRTEDFTWLCNRLAFTPDEFSVPWETSLASAVGYTTVLTTTQAGHAKTNAFNLIMPFGNSQTYVAGENGVGVNLAGRQVAEVVTRHWFKRRLQEAVAAEKIAYSARGEKIPVSVAGSAVLQALVEDLFEQGVRGAHFIAGQTQADFPIPTSADITNSRIRGGGSAQLATSAGTFPFTLLFTRDAVVEAE